MCSPTSDRGARRRAQSDPERSPTRRIVMWIMALAVLLPSLYGFGTKFLEFIALYRGDVDGAFAISPILNYLLASLGFLCLLGWAMLHGMFRDIEQPKRNMLANEAWLDAQVDGPRRRQSDVGRRSVPNRRGDWNR